ncbi:hypothetical protein GCM10011335_37580 [Aureimonas glaciei]|uniref:Uncharacterized protein n=1 Tax=Aureimonas glaciei TaxID=1776957 RepID=A0A917DDF6_9HYPH|nr:hypothetical protein GCM10011335_37580 [Aureimonas glaciei]
MTIGQLPIPIRGCLPAAVNAGEASPPNGLAGLSLEAALLSDPIREPATLPVLNQGCATVAAVRIVNGGIAVLRVASAGPAKGSVFKEICRSFRRALHTRNRKGWRLSLVQQVVGELRNV